MVDSRAILYDLREAGLDGRFNGRSEMKFSICSRARARIQPLGVAEAADGPHQTLLWPVKTQATANINMHTSKMLHKVIRESYI